MPRGKPLCSRTSEMRDEDLYPVCEESNLNRPTDEPICVLNALPARAAATTALGRAPAADGCGVSRGMSDRMEAIEALSTIEPACVGPDQEPFAGESFAWHRESRITPARIALLSAIVSAVLVTAAHMVLSDVGESQATAKADAPLQLGMATTPVRALR